MINRYLPAVYLVTALIFSALPYLIHGYPLGHDSINSLIRLKEYQLALADHQFPPYWAGNLYGGFGSPIFLFYAPLYMIVATLFYLLTESLISGSLLTIFLFTIIGAAGIYLLVEEALEEKSPVNQCAARIAVYLFILNPYLMSDKIIRIANSEYIAICLMPIAFYGLLKIKREPLAGCLIIAAGLALAILAHNLTALILFAMLCILAFILYFDRSNQRTGLWILGAVLFGLLLSIFFWLPALYYKSLTHTERLTQGYYDFHNHFEPLTTFFNHAECFSMGLLNLWVIIKTAMIFRTRRWPDKEIVQKTLTKACLLFILILIFLQTKLSLPIWENVPYLALFQFPWRMMGPLAMIIALIAGLCFPIYYKNNHYTSHRRLELAVLLLSIANISPLLIGAPPPFESLIKNLQTALENRSINSIVLTSTEVDEYLPKAAKIQLKPYNKETSPLILNSSNEARIKVIKETGTEIILESQANKADHLEIKRWYFPDWKATIDGVEHPVGFSDKGLVTIEIPSGHQNIFIKLHPPVLRRFMVWISLTTLFIWLLIAIRCRISGDKRAAI